MAVGAGANSQALWPDKDPIFSGIDYQEEFLFFEIFPPMSRGIFPMD